MFDDVTVMLPALFVATPFTVVVLSDPRFTVAVPSVIVPLDSVTTSVIVPLDATPAMEKKPLVLVTAFWDVLWIVTVLFASLFPLESRIVPVSVTVPPPDDEPPPPPPPPHPAMREAERMSAAKAAHFLPQSLIIVSIIIYLRSSSSAGAIIRDFNRASQK